MANLDIRRWSRLPSRNREATIKQLERALDYHRYLSWGSYQGPRMYYYSLFYNNGESLFLGYKYSLKFKVEVVIKGLGSYMLTPESRGNSLEGAIERVLDLLGSAHKLGDPKHMNPYGDGDTPVYCLDTVEYDGLYHMRSRLVTAFGHTDKGALSLANRAIKEALKIATP